MWVWVREETVGARKRGAPCCALATVVGPAPPPLQLLPLRLPCPCPLPQLPRSAAAAAAASHPPWSRYRLLGPGVLKELQPDPMSRYTWGLGWRQ